LRLTSQRRVSGTEGGRTAGLLAVLLLVGGAASAQEATDPPSEKPPIRRLRVSLAASEIRVDGRLDEPAWQQATLIDLPFEREPGENTPPPVRTECLITYDARNLYVGFRAFDPEPAKIRAHLMDRDQIDTLVQDDYVGFMLDTFNDQRRAFQFRINPLGVQAEALNGAGDEDWEWNIIWASAGQITDEGYFVEVSIPFSQLRFPSGDDELTFGFQGMRSWPRNLRHRLLSNYRDYADACWMCDFARVSGFRDLELGHNLEVTPTLTSSRTDSRADFPEGELEAGELDVEPGVSVRWGITPSLTLDGTVNPDFSQVEADVAQLEVNERFALLFPETRPFFLEGIDYFRTPIEAVFTRTVADPKAGGKLTGKLGSNALGLFVTQDRINNLVIPSNQFSSFDSVDADTTNAIMRYRRDVGRTSTLGALFAGREGTGYHNRVFGLDGSLQVASADTIEFQYLHSDTLYPEEVALRQGQSLEAFGGNGFRFDYSHATRHWYWEVDYEDLSPGFRADSGFIPRVDLRRGHLFLQRSFWGDPDDWWTTFRLGSWFEHIEDHGGQLTDQSVGITSRLDLPLQSVVVFEVFHNKEYFAGETFGLNRSFFHLEMQPTGGLKLRLQGLLGDEVDTFNAQKGDLLNLRPRAELKLGRHLNLNLAHSYQRLDVPGGRLFTESLSEARIVYTFNVRTFVRLILQYRNVTRDPALFPVPVEPQWDRLFMQLLASYKLNPKTVAYVGYTDDFEGRRNLNLTQTNRTFFFKLGYAWTL